MQDVPEPLKISNETFRYVITAMIIGIAELDERRPLGRSSDLAEAMLAALDNNRETLLIEVADVLAPPLPPVKE